MSYDPESTVARPLLALTTSHSSSAYPNSRYRPLHRRPRAILLFVAALLTLLAATAYFGPAAGIPVPERFVPYYHYDAERPSWHDNSLHANSNGNAPPPPHGAGVGGGDGHAHALPPPGGGNGHAPLDTEAGVGAGYSGDPGNYTAAAISALRALLAAQPATVAAARARYQLKTGREPPKGFDAFVSFAQERRCLVDAYAGVRRDFAPFWRAELYADDGKRGWFKERVKKVAEKLLADSHGLTALTVKDGRVHRPDYQGTYFDGDWEATIGKFAAHLPPMTVIVNGRDEPRVVFDAKTLFGEPSRESQSTNSLVLSDSTPFGLSPPSTAAFFAPRPGCVPAGLGEGGKGDVSFLLSASSAEFTTDLVPVLSMTKLADPAGVAASGVGIGAGLEAAMGMGGKGGGEHTCFVDIMVPGEFYYRNSWWAGKFEYPNNVPWVEKKDILYWRGKSNGGHIRGTNYKSFPRFRLIDLAARPENMQKGLFDVRITSWHESHCTDDCDAEAIKKEYNIGGEVEPREEAYKYKYLLDVDGNSFSGRYLGLLRSGGLVFKSTAFAEFFTPWLVPFEHFIPVRPDLADLPAKIEWARGNDAEAHRIQESGRIFAEQVLTDAQNDCYWFAVLLEWGALWGEEVE
ncbi:glycosyl transferase family 90-domain-containing protein [Mycena crocata]|nr:glycosyl transferase family 90-domain-containing protein [Mycena crocata]